MDKINLFYKDSLITNILQKKRHKHQYACLFLFNFHAGKPFPDNGFMYSGEHPVTLGRVHNVTLVSMGDFAGLFDYFYEMNLIGFHFVLIRIALDGTDINCCLFT